MEQDKIVSPQLDLEITPDLIERAIQRKSGGCLIAEAIKAQYPQYSRVSVDGAFIRFTDRAKCLRFIYATPRDAQKILIYFDQGLPNPIQSLKLRRAMAVTPVVYSRYARAQADAYREKRRMELETKENSSEPMSPMERRSLTRIRNFQQPPEGETSKGPVADTPGRMEMKSVPQGVIRRGRTLISARDNPNMLPQSGRIFGHHRTDADEIVRDIKNRAVAQALAEADLRLEAAIRQAIREERIRLGLPEEEPDEGEGGDNVQFASIVEVETDEDEAE